MTPWQRIAAVLRKHGPLTTHDIRRHLPDLTVHDVSAALSHHRTRCKTKAVYRAGWIYDDRGRWLQLRAVYALGDEPCVPRPKVKSVHRERANERRQAKRRIARSLASTPASVFDLGRLA